eukprot:gene14513-biopygen14189
MNTARSEPAQPRSRGFWWLFGVRRHRPGCMVPGPHTAGAARRGEHSVELHTAGTLAQRRQSDTGRTDRRRAPGVYGRDRVGPGSTRGKT